MKRIVFLDYVRVFACFLVMVVHASENFSEPPVRRTWWDHKPFWQMRQTGYGCLCTTGFRVWLYRCL